MVAVTCAEPAKADGQEAGLPHREARALVDMSIEALAVCLAAGEEVKIHGLGSFGPRDKAERPGPNPGTLEAAPVAARRVVMFRASRVLKKRTAGSLPGGGEGRRV